MKDVYEVYKDEEIIGRLIDETKPLYGPTGYMVEINYVAPNDCEPPAIAFKVYENRELPAIIEHWIDQNMTFEDFDEIIKGIRHSVALCCYAIRNKTSYKQESEKANENARKLREQKEKGEEELPF